MVKRGNKSKFTPLINRNDDEPSGSGPGDDESDYDYDDDYDNQKTSTSDLNPFGGSDESDDGYFDDDIAPNICVRFYKNYFRGRMLLISIIVVVLWVLVTSISIFSLNVVTIERDTNEQYMKFLENQVSSPSKCLNMTNSIMMLNSTIPPYFVSTFNQSDWQICNVSFALKSGIIEANGLTSFLELEDINSTLYFDNLHWKEIKMFAKFDLEENFSLGQLEFVKKGLHLNENDIIGRRRSLSETIDSARKLGQLQFDSPSLYFSTHDISLNMGNFATTLSGIPKEISSGLYFEGIAKHESIDELKVLYDMVPQDDKLMSGTIDYQSLTFTSNVDNATLSTVLKSDTLTLTTSYSQHSDSELMRLEGDLYYLIDVYAAEPLKLSLTKDDSYVKDSVIHLIAHQDENQESYSLSFGTTPIPIRSSMLNATYDPAAQKDKRILRDHNLEGQLLGDIYFDSSVDFYYHIDNIFQDPYSKEALVQARPKPDENWNFTLLELSNIVLNHGHFPQESDTDSTVYDVIHAPVKDNENFVINLHPWIHDFYVNCEIEDSRDFGQSYINLYFGPHFHPRRLVQELQNTECIKSNEKPVCFEDHCFSIVQGWDKVLQQMDSWDILPRFKFQETSIPREKLFQRWEETLNEMSNTGMVEFQKKEDPEVYVNIFFKDLFVTLLKETHEQCEAEMKDEPIGDKIYDFGFYIFVSPVTNDWTISQVKDLPPWLNQLDLYSEAVVLATLPGISQINVNGIRPPLIYDSGVSVLTKIGFQMADTSEGPMGTVRKISFSSSLEELDAVILPGGRIISHFPETLVFTNQLSLNYPSVKITYDEDNDKINVGFQGIAMSQFQADKILHFDVTGQLSDTEAHFVGQSKTMWDFDDFGEYGANFNYKRSSMIDINFDVETRTFKSIISGKAKIKDQISTYKTTLGSNRCILARVQDPPSTILPWLDSLADNVTASNTVDPYHSQTLQTQLLNPNVLLFPNCQKAIIEGHLEKTTLFGSGIVKARWAVQKYAECEDILDLASEMVKIAHSLQRKLDNLAIEFDGVNLSLEAAMKLVADTLRGTSIPCIIKAGREETYEEFNEGFHVLVRTIADLYDHSKNHLVEHYNVNAGKVHSYLIKIFNTLSEKDRKIIFDYFALPKQMGFWGAQLHVQPDENEWRFKSAFQKEITGNKLEKLHFTKPTFVYSTTSTSTFPAPFDSSDVSSRTFRDERAGTILPQGLMMYGTMTSSDITELGYIRHMFQESYTEETVQWDGWVSFNTTELNVRTNATNALAKLNKDTTFKGLYLTLRATTLPILKFSTRAEINFHPLNFTYWSDAIYDDDDLSFQISGLLENNVSSLIGHKPFVILRKETTMDLLWSVINAPTLALQIFKSNLSPRTFIESGLVQFSIDMLDVERYNSPKLSNGTSVGNNTIHLNDVLGQLIDKRILNHIHVPPSLSHDVYRDSIRKFEINIDLNKNYIVIEGERKSPLYGVSPTRIVVQHNKKVSTVLSQMGRLIEHKVTNPHVYVSPKMHVNLTDLLHDISNRMETDEFAQINLMLKQTDEEEIDEYLKNSLTIDYDVDNPPKLSDMFRTVKDIILANNTHRHTNVTETIFVYNSQNYTLPFLLDSIEKALTLDQQMPNIVPNYWGDWALFEKVTVSEGWNIFSHIPEFQDFPELTLFNSFFLMSTHRDVIKIKTDFGDDTLYYSKADIGFSFYAITDIAEVDGLHAMYSLTTRNDNQKLLQLRTHFHNQINTTKFHLNQFSNPLWVNTDMALTEWEIIYSLPNTWSLIAKMSTFFNKLPLVQNIKATVNTKTIEFVFDRKDESSIIPVGDKGIPVYETNLSATWKRPDNSQDWGLYCDGNMSLNIGDYHVPIGFKCNTDSKDVSLVGHMERVNHCFTNNGGCGDPKLFNCRHALGSSESICEKKSACDINNGGCDKFYDKCLDTKDGVVCQKRDLCKIWNGACGDRELYSCKSSGKGIECAAKRPGVENKCFKNTCKAKEEYCTNNINLNGTFYSCIPLNPCMTNNGGCGSKTYYKCLNIIGGTNECKALFPTFTPRFIRQELLYPYNLNVQHEMMRLLDKSVMKSFNVTLVPKKAAIVFKMQAALYHQDIHHLMNVIVAPAKNELDRNSSSPYGYWGFVFGTELSNGAIPQLPGLNTLSKLTINDPMLHVTTINDVELLSTYELAQSRWLSKGESGNITNGLHLGGSLVVKGTAALDRIHKWTSLPSVDFHVGISDVYNYTLITDIKEDMSYTLFQGASYIPSTLDLIVTNEIIYKMKSQVALQFGQVEADILHTHGDIIISPASLGRIFVSYVAHPEQIWKNPYGATGFSLSNITCRLTDTGHIFEDWKVDVDGLIKIGKYDGTAKIVNDPTDITTKSAIEANLFEIPMPAILVETFDSELNHTEFELTLNSMSFKKNLVHISSPNEASSEITINKKKYKRGIQISSELIEYFNNTGKGEVFVDPLTGVNVTGSGDKAVWGPNEILYVENPTYSLEIPLYIPIEGIKLHGKTRLQGGTFDSVYLLQDTNLTGNVKFISADLVYSLNITTDSGHAGKNIEEFFVHGTLDGPQLSFVNTDVQSNVGRLQDSFSKKVTYFKQQLDKFHAQWDTDSTAFMNAIEERQKSFKDANINGVPINNISLAYISGMIAIEAEKRLELSNALKTKPYYDQKKNDFFNWADHLDMISIHTINAVYNASLQMKEGATKTIQRNGGVVNLINQHFGGSQIDVGGRKFSANFLDANNQNLKRKVGETEISLSVAEHSFGECTNVTNGLIRLRDLMNGDYTSETINKKVLKIVRTNSQLENSESCEEIGSPSPDKLWSHHEHPFYDDFDHDDCIEEHEAKVRVAYGSTEVPREVPQSVLDNINKMCMQHHIATKATGVCADGLHKDEKLSTTYEDTLLHKITFKNHPKEFFAFALEEEDFQALTVHHGVFDSFWRALVAGDDIRITINATFANEQKLLPIFVNLARIHDSGKDLVETLVKYMDGISPSLFIENKKPARKRRAIKDPEARRQTNERLYKDKIQLWKTYRQEKAIEKEIKSSRATERQRRNKENESIQGVRPKKRRTLKVPKEEL